MVENRPERELTDDQILEALGGAFKTLDPVPPAVLERARRLVGEGVIIEYPNSRETPLDESERNLDIVEAALSGLQAALEEGNIGSVQVRFLLPPVDGQSVVVRYSSLEASSEGMPN